jgi:SagB-type dehydrogenase family enzyme
VVSRGDLKRARGACKSNTKHDLYRRAPFIVSYWQDGEFVLENFLAQRRVSCDPLAASILHFFGRDRSLSDLFAALPGYSQKSLRTAIRRLEAHSLLQRSGEKSLNEEKLTAWHDWNPTASYFHLSTKDMKFAEDAGAEFRSLVRLAKSKPMPRPVKRYSKARQFALPAPVVEGEFPRVLEARRTWRRFSGRAVSQKTLGTLLGLTWGVRKWVKIPQLGEVAMKTSPSGGALHPIEAYVVARKVENLPPGLYHYSGADHRLELLRRGATSKQITRLLVNQYWYADAALVVFMTAVFGRTQWKYDYPRAYRAMLLEAGHLCQTFCLTATWLGLAPFCTLAFADSEVEKAIGVDGVSESALYVAGAGVRPENEWEAHLLSGSELGRLKL